MNHSSSTHDDAHASGWHAFIHHLQLALLVASLVGLLHHAGALGWLDAVMLRLSGSVHARSIQPPGPDAAPPEVFLIGEDLYENPFGQRAPLDRQRLASLIRAVPTDEAQRPATVVIDLDLSPVTGDEAAQAKLDDALKALAEADIRVVLPLPTPVGTQSLQRLKADWLQRACQWRSPAPHGHGRVLLANTEMITHAGQALQFDPAAFTLGVAAALPGDSEEFDDLCQSGKEQQMAAVSSALPTPALRLHHTSRTSQEPYNAHYFGGADAHIHLLSAPDRLPETGDHHPVPLAGHTLFIGGAYDSRDRFSTPLDPTGQTVEGVVMHAATYYSALHRVEVDMNFIALALDIVAGIGLGYLFAWSWGCHAKAQSLRRRDGGWLGYVAPKLTLVMNFALAAVLVAALVWAAASWAYPHNWWVSPGPMVLGMFTKFLLTSRPGDHAPAQAPLPAAAPWIDRLVFIGLVLANIGVIVMHGMAHH